MAAATVPAPAAFAAGNRSPSAVRGSGDAANRVAVVTPFEPLPGHGAPIIRVYFADGVVGRFMIDTGASYSVMTRGMAKRLGLKPVPAAFAGGQYELHMGSDHGRQSEFVTVPTMRVGNIDLTGGAQFVMVDDADFFRFGDEKVDGLIGNSLMDQAALLINYPKRTLTLYIPGGLSDDELANLHMGAENGAAKVKLSSEIDHGFAMHQFSATLRLQNGDKNATETVYVDTGAGSTSISQGVAAALGLSAIGKQGASTMGDGSVWGSVAKVPTVVVGDLALHDFLVEYPGRTGGHEIPPLMGEDVLGYCVALWDFPQHNLYLRPALPPLKPLAPNAPPTDPSRIDASRLRVDASRLPPVEYADSLSGDTDDDATDANGVTPARGESAHERILFLTRLLKNDSSDAARWNQIGDLHWEEKDREKAMEAYQKSVALYREQIADQKPKAANEAVTFRSNFAFSLCDANEDEEAEKTARSLVADFPQNAQAWDTLGHVLHRRSLRALTGANRSVDVEPQDLSEFRVLVERLKAAPPTKAQQQAAENLSREARDAFNKAVEVAPDDYKTYVRRSNFLADSGLGITATLAGLKGEDVNVFAFSYLPEGVRDLEKAADLAPDNILVVLHAAVAAANAPVYRNEHGFDFREGKFWESLPPSTRRSVDKQIRRLKLLGESQNLATAGRARAQEALGRIQYEIVQDYPAAEATLRAALAADPKRGYAAQTLAELLASDRRYGEIETIFGAAVAKEGDASHAPPLLHLWIGAALARRDDWDGAQTHFDAAVARAPESLEANLLCALSLLQNSDGPGGAEKVARAGICLKRAEQAMGLHPTVDRLRAVRHARAIFFGLSGNPDKARTVALTALADDRRDTTARDIVAAVTP